MNNVRSIMRKNELKEIAIILLGIVFLTSLIFLTIQSIIGHKSIFMSVLLTVVAMIILFILIQKIGDESYDKKDGLHKNTQSRCTK